MKLTANQKRTIIAKHMETAQGRELLAASMDTPLREMRDYQGVGRRALQVDELGQGEIPYYDKDIDTPAFVVAEEGNDVMAVIRGKRINVALREIAANPMIPLTQIRQRRYNVNQRVKEKVLAEIVREEDRLIFNMFNKICFSTIAPNKHMPVAKADMSIDAFSEAIGQLEGWGDIKAMGIFMNPSNMTVLRRINKDYYIDFETSKQLLQVGMMGNLYGASINTSSVIPKDTIYVCGEPEFLGRVVVGQDITVLSADNPTKREVGFSVFEEVGFMVHNPKAIIAIKIV